MKKFAKILCFVLTLVLALAIFASCGEKKDDQPKDVHTHTAGEEWFVDRENHWHICKDDNEKTDVSKHTFEEGVCTVCNVHITEYDNSAAELCFYDEHDNWIELYKYDSEGNLTTEKAEYTYDENGCMLSFTSYEGERKTTECKYIVDDSGYSVESELTVYSEDGSSKKTEYNTKGDVIKETSYKADGSVETETKYEISYYENGARSEEKQYVNDKLTKEIKYIVASEDSWGGKIYNQQITTYNEDGTTTVETLDENGNPLNA